MGRKTRPVYDRMIALLGRAVTELRTTRPVVETIRPSQPVPVIALAYDLYEDTNRGREIVENNDHITHPSFAPASDLEVLSR